MASTYLTQTPSSSGNRKTFTLSLWMKRSSTSYETFAGTGSGSTYLMFNISSDQPRFFQSTNAGESVEVQVSNKLRDCNAWYHLVFRVDTTQSTASDRVRIYINGEEASYAVTDYPSQNLDLYYNYNILHGFGARADGDADFSGCMSHVHFADGQSLAPTVFGETDSTTGEWKIITNPSFTLGTNGYSILKDGNTVTDQSTNSNDWTVAAGTLTKTEDCPSNVFCTMNPLMVNPSATNTFANGNNTVTINATDACVGATLGANSGKFYWEQKWTQQGANDRWGVCPDDASMSNHPRTTGIGWDTASTQFYLLGSAVSGSWGGSIGTSEIIQIALDLDNSALYLGVNGTWRNSGNPTSGSSRTGAVNFSSSSLVGKFLLPAFGKGNQDNSTMQYNFGNGYFGTTAVSSAGTNASGIGIFEYDVPTGFTALSTKGLNE